MSSRDDKVMAAVHGKRAGRSGWVRGNCPWCVLVAGKEDRKASLSLQTETGKWHCFRCSSAGMINGGGFEPPTDMKPRELVKIELPEGHHALWTEPALSARCYRPAYDYLASRGLDMKMIKRVHIGAVATGYYAGRVVVPINDMKGGLGGWVARTWLAKTDMDMDKKYLYCPGMQRGSLLYNAPALQVETDEPVLVVEGVFDTFPFWPHAVAVLGKPSPEQMQALVEAKRPVAIILDGDAWREGDMMAMHLRLSGQRAGAVHLPPRVDPDELPVEFLKEEARACLAA